MSKKKYIFFIIVGILFITLLIIVPLTKRHKKDLGRDINNFTPIALVDNSIVYNYISDDNSLVIGYYDINTKNSSDIVSEKNFYISNSLTAVIDNSVYLSITNNTNEHKLLKIDIDSKTCKTIFKENNSYYPIDTISTMQDSKIYMLSNKIEGSTLQTSYIRKYNSTTGNMDICIKKEFDKEKDRGDIIKAFACNNAELYVLANEKDNNIVIEEYDDKYNLKNTFTFDDELKKFILSNDIVQFYCFDDYIYLRNYSDYGAIGKIENNQIKSLLTLPNLRMAYNNKNTNDKLYAFFIREGREFYILDTIKNNLNKIKLNLSQNESIRNAISDGTNVCVSILDDKNTEIFKTKETLILDYKSLLKKVLQKQSIEDLKK